MSRDHIHNLIKSVLTIFMIAIGLSQNTSHADSTKSVVVTAGEFEFSPAKIQANTGQVLEFTLENQGALAHNITFPDNEVATETIQGGDRTTVTVSFDKPGRYEFVCSVPGHENAGMKGVVIVD